MKRTNITLKTAIFIAVMILFGSLAQDSRAATYTVDSTSDVVALTSCTETPNDCNLRGAVLRANATTDDDTIDFAIPANAVGCDSSGVCTITLSGSQLTVNRISTAGKLTITNSSGASKLLISGNNASRVFFISGNGSDNGYLTLDGVTVTKGNNSLEGGGISNNGVLALTNSTVTENVSGTGGGGIFNFRVVTITNSTISNNSAVFGAGVWKRYDSDLTITNSTISGNSAADYGGGIAEQIINSQGFSGLLTITNSTISGNSAVNNGGGIYSRRLFSLFFSPMPTLTGVTITGNSSTAPNSSGGGVSFYLQDNIGEAILKNTIIAGNQNANAPDIYGTLNGTSAYNLIGNGTEMTDNTGGANSNQVGTAANPINPLLAPLAENGGATKTHALLSGSPAIDKGNSFGLATDQRGLFRPVEFSSIPNTSDGSDVGAFELQTPTAASVSVSGRILTARGRSVGRARVNLTDSQGQTRTTISNMFGHYRFENLTVGETYVFTVASKRLRFAAQVLSVFDETTELNFIAEF